MSEEQVLTIQDSTLSFSTLSHDIVNLNWEKLGILILPSDQEHKAFYAGTLEILDYFSERLDPEKVDIYTSDEEYRELTLHSRDFRLGTFLVMSMFIPIFVNVLSSYISDHLKADANDNVAVTVVVEKKDGSSKRLQYTGKAGNLKELVEAIKGL